MTAQQLADELEVSVRTVYRDIESLHAAGVPLFGEAGHEGGYELLAGYRTRLTGLTSDEAEALFLTGLPGPAADLGLGAVLATARLKLMAALPAELRDRANLLRQRFHLDTSGWYLDPDRAPHLAEVVSATWNQNLIRVRYRRWAPRPEVVRTLAPYGVVLKGGRWYLVAAAESRVRTYRVSQIVRLDLLDQRFDRPAGFDLAEHWDGYLRDFDDRRHTASASIRLSPRALDLLPHVWEPALVRAVRRSGRAEESGDWSRARIPMESVEHTAGLLLRLGADVEVIAPEGLRRHVAEVVTTLSGMYQVH
ncbi:WYL domain-containing protein [Pseudonocardia eucalypti]|uniref:WYL domain-containing protein n=2 Tax=Pseudonocardia eucalypti TaxID=648755 RepID=A0ABP9PT72_9PSEU